MAGAFLKAVLEFSFGAAFLFAFLKSFGMVIVIMSQDQLIKLNCSVCKRTNYWSRKNKKKVERKIELKKFCKWCKKRTVHKEAKK